MDKTKQHKTQKQNKSTSNKKRNIFMIAIAAIAGLAFAAIGPFGVLANNSKADGFKALQMNETAANSEKALATFVGIKKYDAGSEGQNCTVVLTGEGLNNINSARLAYDQIGEDGKVIDQFDANNNWTTTKFIQPDKAVVLTILKKGETKTSDIMAKLDVAYNCDGKESVTTNKFVRHSRTFTNHLGGNCELSVAGLQDGEAARFVYVDDQPFTVITEMSTSEPTNAFLTTKPIGVTVALNDTNTARIKPVVNCVGKKQEQTQEAEQTVQNNLTPDQKLTGTQRNDKIVQTITDFHAQHKNTGVTRAQLRTLIDSNYKATGNILTVQQLWDFNQANK